ncbi:MAG TPA: helix-turn-helix domain-containing protein [Cellvibrionaceae bacterium]
MVSMTQEETRDLTISGQHHYSSAYIDDAAIQAALQPWAAMECYQLGSGRHLAQMEVLNLGRQQVVRETQLASVQKLGVTPPGFCTLSYCTPAPNFRFSELGVDSSTIFFMPERTEYDIYVPEGIQTSYISFQLDNFLQGAQALNPAQWERAPRQLQSIHNGQQPALQSAITQWLQCTQAFTPAQSEQFNEQLLQQVLLIATAQSADYTPLSLAERLQAFHTCRKARSYIEECFGLDIVPSISAICRVVGVSERNLQYAFRAYVNMSPLAYLRACRLSSVRTLLRTSNAATTTVTAVAMRFGFLHLGRFASDYKNTFGEFPSATLEARF